jgi:hypothetical protein
LTTPAADAPAPNAFATPPHNLAKFRSLAAPPAPGG